MNQFLAIPIEFRVAGAFFLGVIVAGILNLGIYRLAWSPRLISPWSPPPQGAVLRNWLDRIPITGWLRLRRESSIHGAGFWIRPMLIELLVGAAFAALYWWEIQMEGLLPPPIDGNAPALAMTIAVNKLHLHGALCSHLILLCLMTVATFIDIDEKTIPDAITVPGTLVGLLLAALYPWSLLPAEVYQPNLVGMRLVEFLQIAVPLRWALVMDGALDRLPGLAIGLGCFGLWCFALLPRTWHGRYGIVRATRYFFARVLRDLGVIDVAVFLLVTAAIAFCWRLGGESWAGLLTALVGMATGGGMIWAVRLIGTFVLRREAMGFGDVTLMAMIGAFVGWQTCLFIFFLAPIAGLFIGVLQWLINRDKQIPYGPFLCVATLVIIVRWAWVWSAFGPVFWLGRLIPIIMICCLAAMALMLAMLQLVKAAARRLF